MISFELYFAPDVQPDDVAKAVGKALGAHDGDVVAHHHDRTRGPMEHHYSLRWDLRGDAPYLDLNLDFANGAVLHPSGVVTDNSGPNGRPADNARILTGRSTALNCAIVNKLLAAFGGGITAYEDHMVEHAQPPADVVLPSSSWHYCEFTRYVPVKPKCQWRLEDVQPITFEDFLEAAVLASCVTYDNDEPTRETFDMVMGL